MARLRTLSALLLTGVALVGPAVLDAAPPVASASMSAPGPVTAHGSGGDEGTFTVPATPANPASVDDPATPVSPGDGSSLVVLVVVGALVLVAVGVWGAVVVLRGGSSGGKENAEGVPADGAASDGEDS